MSAAMERLVEAINQSREAEMEVGRLRGAIEASRTEELERQLVEATKVAESKNAEINRLLSLLFRDT